MLKASDIIKLCGGHKAVADYCRISTNATAGWVRQNRIPAQRWKAVIEMTSKTRYPVTLDDLAASHDQ